MKRGYKIFARSQKFLDNWNRTFKIHSDVNKIDIKIEAGDKKDEIMKTKRKFA